MMTAEDLKRLVDEASLAAAAAHNEQELKLTEIKFLGRKSRLTLFLRGLKDLPSAERAKMGSLARVRDCCL